MISGKSYDETYFVYMLTRVAIMREISDNSLLEVEHKIKSPLRAFLRPIGTQANIMPHIFDSLKGVK